jgi:heat shock protein HslJ/uncharacterized protein YraI
MEAQPDNNTPNSNRNLLYILIGLVAVLILVGIALLVASLSRGESPGQDEATPTAIVLPTAELPTQPTDQPVAPVSSPTPVPPAVLPTPEPQNPTGRVTAPNGVNLRTGPGEVYPIIGIAPFGAEGLITGRSADAQWWVVFMPTAPNAQAWVSAQFVAATNANNVPVIAAPPTPTPLPTNTPSATATPTLSFSADRTTINQGECTTLRWQVENIQAVWVYPMGQPHQNFPVTGQGSRQECPPQTTTYEMRVQQLDGRIVIQQITITVIITNPLANTSWQLVNLNMGTVPVPGSSVTISFGSDGRLTTNGGCNTLSGAYSVSGSNIIVGSLSGTMLTCGDALDQQERAYTIALQAAATYEIVGNQLIIRNTAGQEVLRYNRTG